MILNPLEINELLKKERRFTQGSKKDQSKVEGPEFFFLKLFRLLIVLLMTGCLLLTFDYLITIFVYVS